MMTSMYLARPFEVALYSVWGVLVLSFILGMIKNTCMELGKGLMEFYLSRKTNIIKELEKEFGSKASGSAFGTH
jgi:hypothetical protein